jgi:hypothetical protein
LKEFAAIVAKASPSILEGHLRNHDFSRWISDVFKDNPLAAQLKDLEEQYQISRVPDVNDAVIRLIQDRYKINPGD